MSTVAAAPLDRPSEAPGMLGATIQVAARVLHKYFRTPGLFAMGIVQGALFLFFFRYVFGGSIQAGVTRYVDYLVPGYVATIVLFTGSAIAVGVAEDRLQGLTDRLLSLPIARTSLVAGRALADFSTNGWSIAFTAAVGFIFGFRLPGSVADALGALALCLLYAFVFTVAFIVIGLYSPNAQAAQGLSMVGFVLAFISSTYVDPASMPGWLRPFAEHQPVTPMVDAVRSTLAGTSHDLLAALVWSVALLAVLVPVAVLRYRRP